MEEGLMTDGWQDQISEVFKLKEKDWKQYSPLTLAWIGDAVFELVIRTVLVKQANIQTAKLHQKSSGLVKAGTQAAMAEVLLPHLTEEEAGVLRRGRNAKPYHTAKNAERKEYLAATGLEALVGYLYLKKDYQRLTELVRLGLEESGYAL